MLDVTVDGEEAGVGLVVFVGDVETADGHVALLFAKDFANGFVEDALHRSEFFGGARFEEGRVVVVR